MVCCLIRRLPLPPRLKPGQVLDGLRIEELLHESRVTLLYRVTRLADGLALVLKTLLPDADDEAAVPMLSLQPGACNLLTLRALAFSLFPLLLGLQHVKLAAQPLTRKTLRPMWQICRGHIPSESRGRRRRRKQGSRPRPRRAGWTPWSS